MTTDAVGGVWNYSLGLAAGLGNHRVEVVLACMGPAPDSAKRRDVEALDNVTFCHKPYKLEWMDSPWNDIREAGKWLVEISRQENPALVHLNGYPHASLDWQQPVITVGHSCVFSWFQSVKGENPPSEWDEYYRQVKKGFHAADTVVAPTHAILDQYEKIYGKFGAKHVIYNGLPMNQLAANNCSDKKNFIFSMGRLWDEAKNIRLLLEAAPYIHCPIFIAGTKPENSGAIPENVFFLGQLCRKEIERWLKKAALYVLPVKYEPFGLSFLEAAASGCAIVGGGVDTLQEIWGNAMIYMGTDDPERLAETCNGLLKDVPLRQKMAARAFETAKKYSLQASVARYLNLYNHLIKEVKYA